MAVGEWDEREVCPDGGCVGLIGSDGLCKVCGRAATNWGNERDRGLKDEPEDPATTPRPAGSTSTAAADDLADDEEYEDDDGADDEDDAYEDDEDDGDDDDDDDEDDSLAALDPSTPSLIGGPAEWSERTLCTDGACIGVIGADGTCKVCGKPGPARSKKLAAAPAAAAATPSPAATPAANDDEALAAAATDLAAAVSPEAIAALPDADDVERKLCPDGACVGVIGDDGKCKVCGKVAA